MAGYPARASYTRTLCTQILEYDVLLTGSVHHMTIVTLEQTFDQGHKHEFTTRAEAKPWAGVSG